MRDLERNAKELKATARARQDELNQLIEDGLRAEREEEEAKIRQQRQKEAAAEAAKAAKAAAVAAKAADEEKRKADLEARVAAKRVG